MDTRSPSMEAREIEEAIFETAYGMTDPSLRGAFLSKIFGCDPDGLARMESLIQSARASTAFFLSAQEQRGEIAEEILNEDFVGTPPPPARKSRHRKPRGPGLAGTG